MILVVASNRTDNMMQRRGLLQMRSVWVTGATPPVLHALPTFAPQGPELSALCSLACYRELSCFSWSNFEYNSYHISVPQLLGGHPMTLSPCRMVPAATVSPSFMSARRARTLTRRWRLEMTSSPSCRRVSSSHGSSIKKGAGWRYGSSRDSRLEWRSPSGLITLGPFAPHRVRTHQGHTLLRRKISRTWNHGGEPFG